MWQCSNPHLASKVVLGPWHGCKEFGAGLKTGLMATFWLHLSASCPSLLTPFTTRRWAAIARQKLLLCLQHLVTPALCLSNFWVMAAAPLCSVLFAGQHGMRVPLGNLSLLCEPTGCARVTGEPQAGLARSQKSCRCTSHGSA